MKKTKRLFTLLIAFVMLVGTNLTAFASTNDVSFAITSNSEASSTVIVTDTLQLLDTAQEVETPTTRSAIALVTGTWRIPGVGEVVIL